MEYYKMEDINIDELISDIKSKIPNGAKLLYIAVSGSTAYGLNTEKSDIDLKSVYIQSNYDILSNRYVEQVNITKDHPSYEIRRFIELISKGNPNASELLFSAEKHILYVDEVFRKYILDNKNEFVSKDCYGTFGGYADSQIKKATSSNKKYNWLEVDKKRKTPIDFARIVCKSSGVSKPLNEWLIENEYKEEYIGLSKLDGHRDQYLLFIDEIKYASDNVRFRDVIETRNYMGFGQGNEPKVSKIEKYMKDQWKGVVYWNREAYSTHCKRYKEYVDWTIKSNKERVNTNLEHKQKYDSKNIMHLYRLVLVAESIIKTKTLKVDMSDMRDELLSIKRGERNLGDVIKLSEDKMKLLEQLFIDSDLKETVADEYIQKLEYNIRIECW